VPKADGLVATPLFGVKESTDMTPLQFVTRERIARARAQQLIHETSRSLIENGAAREGAPWTGSS